MTARKLALLLALAPVLAAAPVPAEAQFVLSSPWKLIKPGETRKVAKSNLAITAAGAWNRSSQRPTDNSERWTRDGVALDDLMFITGIKKGKAIFRQRDKKKDPLPKFDPAMLPTDLVELFQNSARIALGGALFEVGEVRPARLAGQDGVHFAYSYASEGDNLSRRGEARAAIIGGRLYLISFDAAAIHYFDAHIADARAMMDGAVMVAKAK